MGTSMDSVEHTILMTRLKVRTESLGEFALWQEKMNQDVSDFPGFISLEMSPQQGEGYVEWSSVQRFRSHQDLEMWQHSPQRKRLLDAVKPMLSEGKADALVEQQLGSDQSNRNVTEVFVTRVTPENYDAYRAWASKIQQVEAGFPGYQGIYIQAPEKEKGGHWITILRFDTPEHLDHWLNSQERQRVLKESELIVEELQSHRVVSPFAGWFSSISNITGESPAVWKQTMLVLLVLFPIVMLELKFLHPLTAHLNPSLATFIGNAISVSLVSWPMMPLVIRFLRWWLAPGAEGRNRKIILGTLLVITLYLIEIACFWHLL